MSFFGRDLKFLERICLKPFWLVVIDLFTPDRSYTFHSAM